MITLLELSVVWFLSLINKLRPLFLLHTIVRLYMQHILDFRVDAVIEHYKHCNVSSVV